MFFRPTLSNPTANLCLLQATIHSVNFTVLDFHLVNTVFLDTALCGAN